MKKLWVPDSGSPDDTVSDSHLRPNHFNQLGLQEAEYYPSNPFIIKDPNKCVYFFYLHEICILFICKAERSILASLHLNTFIEENIGFLATVNLQIWSLVMLLTHSNNNESISDQ